LLVSNLIGLELTDILASLTSISAIVLLMKLWKPSRIFRLEGDDKADAPRKRHGAGQTFIAWTPYSLLVIFVLVWGYQPVKAWLDRATTVTIQVPWLHNMIQRVPPVTALAAVAAAVVLRVTPRQFASVYGATIRQLALPMVTTASVLALAYLMNYSGMTSTLGLAFAATGAAFPFFSAVLGWLGVVLTGSVTSSNALFGNLQVVTANRLGMSPVLTASANAAGGVMGKMISLQSIAVAVAATGIAGSDVGKLFGVMLRQSILLVTVVALLALVYAYWFPSLVPQS
jgi:lactate permease